MVASIISTTISVFVLVISIIAMWTIFKKAGEKGWKAIIPFYNGYVMSKLTWRPLFFWIMLALGILISCASTWTTFNPNATANPLYFISAFIMFAGGIALLVFYIISMYRLSKSFGHGGGWTVGLIFLNFIFMLMLAFGKSEYKGNVYLKERD